MTQSELAAFDALHLHIPVHDRWFSTSHLIGEFMPVERAVGVLASGNPAEIIPEIASFCWRSPANLQLPLSDLIVTLANRLPAGSWPRVDEEVRRRLMIFCHQTDLPFADPGLIVLATCHPSGWVRERAIGHASLLPDAIAIRLLLVRINDWAKPVRHLAERLISPVLARLGAEEKMELVPLVNRLRYCGRHHHSMAVDAWQISLITPFDEDAWLASWHGSQGRDRRVYLELLKQAGTVPEPRVRRALLKSNDRMALLWYLKWILPRLSGEDQEEATYWISRSRAVPVRRFWLEHLVENDPEKAVPALREALTELSRSLRHTARFYLSRLAPMDFTAHYLAALDTPALEAVALRGLTEVSPVDGDREAARRLSSPDPRVRKAAVESLGADQLPEHLERLLEISVEAEPGPSKSARKRLMEIAKELGAHLLANPHVVADFPTSIQRQFISLAPYFGKWQGLEYLLRQMPGNDLREEKAEAVQVWRFRAGRSFIPLKDEPRRRMLQLVDKAPDLDKDLAELLRFILQQAE